MTPFDNSEGRPPITSRQPQGFLRSDPRKSAAQEPLWPSHGAQGAARSCLMVLRERPAAVSWCPGSSLRQAEAYDTGHTPPIFSESHRGSGTSRPLITSRQPQGFLRSDPRKSAAQEPLWPSHGAQGAARGCLMVSRERSAAGTAQAGVVASPQANHSRNDAEIFALRRSGVRGYEGIVRRIPRTSDRSRQRAQPE